MHDLGGGAVKVGEWHKTIENPDMIDQPNPCSHNIITDNTIYDCGRIYTTSVGVWVGYSNNNIISHNELHHIYGSAISVGWGWDEPKGECKGHLIEYNHIHNIGLKETGGGSGIYLMQNNTRCINNHIHDVTRYGGDLIGQAGVERSFDKNVAHPCFGFQLDDNATDMHVENNLVYNVPDAAFKQMGGGHVTLNNVFAFAKSYQVLRRRDQGAIVFKHNIVLADNGKFVGGAWTEKNYDVDENLYWDISDNKVDFVESSFEEWQAEGGDRNSLMADPLFTDPVNGDFTLSPDSPAFKLGFKTIDLSNVGPRK